MYLFVLFFMGFSLLAKSEDILEPEKKIIGGSSTRVSKNPFLVSLRFADKVHYCAGTVVSTKWILTAGHCIYGKSPSDIRVYAGTSLSFRHMSYSFQKRLPLKFHIHPEFKPDSFSNDIGLVELKEELELNEDVQILSLDCDENCDVNCDVLGWGLKNFNKSANKNPLVIVNPIKKPKEEEKETQKPIERLSMFMKRAKLTYIDPWDCFMHYLKEKPGLMFRISIFRQVCAGIEGEGSPCLGDAGGPLVCSGHIIGIVSWGVECGTTGLPTVFTKVSLYSEWVRAKINGSTCCKQNYGLIIALSAVVYNIVLCF